MPVTLKYRVNLIFTGVIMLKLMLRYEALNRVQLVGRSVGRLPVSQSVGRSVGQSVSQSVCQSVSSSISHFVRSVVHFLIQH